MSAKLRHRQAVLKHKVKRAAERAVLQAEQVTQAMQRLEEQQREKGSDGDNGAGDGSAAEEGEHPLATQHAEGHCE